MDKIKQFFNKPFFTELKYILIIWNVMAVVTALKCYFTYNPAENKLTYNNYNIFTGVFNHIISKQHLYLGYPAEYFDSNHYGPFFSLIIAPFALLPDIIGIVLWNLSNTFLLTYALIKLPFNKNVKVIIAWIVAHELLTAQLALQFNIGLLGLRASLKTHFFN